MRSNSVFGKTLFSVALKARGNLLNHFLDSQISFRLNSLLYRKKNTYINIYIFYIHFICIYTYIHFIYILYVYIHIYTYYTYT